MVIWIILAVAALSLIWLLVTYNSLIVARNRVREAFSHIDVQLKRRASLIPNLVEAVKGYVKHEKEVLTKVTEARTALVNANSPQAQAEADNMLTGALKSLFAVAESYPDLKASDNFLKLQEELSDTETKISASRQFYNTNVLDYNNSLQVFPNSTLANMFAFKAEEFFKAQEEEKKEVEVKF